jgi:hypothetical protein
MKKEKRSADRGRIELNERAVRSERESCERYWKWISLSNLTFDES